ncbi:hypothetical protein HETIRDRAFT_312380 [Heterobasidion irregulare TC 32-1]|uniref:Pentacotripeptide-repeat region of PRORP domain-containing protein n=1 Tax=Heterobasidion irregulare (strain TC 32-1) TaxID=747525 RepID=W4KG41_HETIT|nr:uncharacterized protein HETIRDRAFT_312380 [Heterobasidion irregulare TC 32-1]ETW84704.1 hypothetical protein HETIRDRAFT_312380 [Heterobasidion irregulare TC 32-1]
MRILLRSLEPRCTLLRRPSPPSPVHILPRHVSSTLRLASTPEPDHTQHRARWSSVKHLEFSVKRLLALGKPDDALRYFHLKLSSMDDDRGSRVTAYEDAISLFLHYSRFDFASDLYKQMSEDPVPRLRPSPLVEAKMKAVSHLLESTPPTLPDALAPVLARRSCTERDLRGLIDFLAGTLNLDLATITSVVERYADARGADYELHTPTVDKLMSLSLRAGNNDAAEAWFESRADKPSPQEPASPAMLYTTLASELADSTIQNSAQIDAVLARMTKAGVAPDLALFNALIRGSVRHLDLHKAFALYDALRAQRSLAMMPDAFTFGSLFKALQALHHRRTARYRRLKAPPNTRTPRALFREMLECHLVRALAAPTQARAGGARALTTSTLDVALRVFMLTADYPAASVALRAFGEYGLAPDAKTFHVVVVTLMAHMRVDLVREHPPGAVRWIDRFLGADAAAGLRLDDISDELIDDLLAFRPWRPHLQEKDADAHTHAHAQAVERAPKAKFPETFRVPSRFEVLGVTAAPANPRWDIHPLTRLLRRAIHARLGETGLRPVDALALVLEDAAQEMAPALSRSLQRKLTRVERKHAERVRRLRESESGRRAGPTEGDGGECVSRCRAVGC